jgi:hypothetical protein
MEPVSSCPFCGKAADVEYTNKLYWVICNSNNCMVNAKSIICDTREGAVKAWNTRPKLLSITHMNALRSAVKALEKT